MATTFAFFPQLLTRSRPICHAPGIECYLQGLSIYPSEHKHVFAFGILRNNRDKTILVKRKFVDVTNQVLVIRDCLRKCDTSSIGSIVLEYSCDGPFYCYNAYSIKNSRLKKSLKIDLHSHTTASDGKLTPSELVQRAATMQVDMLAITDHDTMNGIALAAQAIDEQKLSLRIIPGVELSTRWQSFGIHIVGLNVHSTCDSFQCFLKNQQTIRQERAERIAEKLERTGFSDILQQAASLANGGELTRAHFGRALVLYHGLASMDVAFKKFLGKGKVGDVKAQWPTMEQAVEAIHQAKGQAVLAHPLKYELSTKWLRRLVVDFAEHGGDGLEVAGPGVAGQKQALLFDIAKNAGLRGSVGSDFHSPGRWTELGRFNYNLDLLPPIWNTWA